MLSNFLAVSAQVLILFALIGVGFILGRTGLVQSSAITSLSNLVLYVSFPCSLISSFQMELTAQSFHDFFLSLALTVGFAVFFFLLSHILIRDADPYRKRVFTLTATLPNAGFMGLPLQTAILGSRGIFLGSPYGIIPPLFMWTVGASYLKGEPTRFELKKVLLNPGILGMAAGLVLFLGQLQLPSLLNQGVEYLACLMTPIPMLIVGIQLSHTNLHSALRDRTGWFSAFLRLVGLPLASIAVLHLIGIGGDVLLAAAIAVSTPPAVAVAMFDSPDATLSAEVISLQTLCSLVTMPLLVTLAQTLI